MVFDPFDLSVEVTPDSIMAALREKQYSIALVMSFRLNEHDLKVRVMESIPIQDGKEEGRGGGGRRGRGEGGGGRKGRREEGEGEEGGGRRGRGEEGGGRGWRERVEGDAG